MRFLHKDHGLRLETKHGNPRKALSAESGEPDVRNVREFHAELCQHRRWRELSDRTVLPGRTYQTGPDQQIQQLRPAERLRKLASETSGGGRMKDILMLSWPYLLTGTCMIIGAVIFPESHRF